MTTFRITLALFLLSTSLTAQLPFEAQITAVVADAGSATTLYAGTPAGVLKSTDSGATWQQAPVNPLGQDQPHVFALIADPESPGTVYLGTRADQGYLWRTVDGGASWQSIAAGLDGPEDFKCDRIFPRSGALYAQLNPIGFERVNTQYWRSTDNGASWQLRFTSGSDVDISYSVPPVMFRPGGFFKVERSNDEGESWETAGIVRQSPAGALDGINSIAISPLDDDILISTASGPTSSQNGIFRSTDGGGSWTRVVTTNSIGVRFDPANKSQAFAGDCCGRISFYRSSDGGVNWQEIKVRELTGFNLASLTLAAPGSTFFVPTARGVYTGRRTDPAWTRTGTYNPTLTATPPALATTLLARGSSSVRTSVILRSLEDPQLKFPAITITAEAPDWLTVTDPAPGSDRFSARLDAVSAGPGVYRATIRAAATDAINKLEIPVTLTVTGEVRHPFVILDEPLPVSPAPSVVTLDPEGNTVYASSRQIFRLGPDKTATAIAGNGEFGSAGDGGPAVDAELRSPEYLAYDAEGILYVGVTDLIRRIDKAGVIETVAGKSGGFDRPEDGDVATEINLTSQGGIAVDADGALHFVANDRIWRLQPDGTIKLIAGGGNSTTDNVRAVVASLTGVENIAFNPDGELVFSEQDMHRVRVIDKAGMVRTLAGSGVAGYDGDGGSPLQAKLSQPDGIAFDAAGLLYFTDQDGRVIRRIRANGAIETVMGNGAAGDTGFCTAAETAPAQGLHSLVFTPEGWLLVVDGSDSFRLWIGNQANGDSPAVDPGAVVNAASFVPQLSEGGLFSVFGQRIAAREEQAQGSWPYLLGDAIACLDDEPLPLYYTSTGQINGQVFYGITSGSHWMRVYSLTGSSSAIEVDVAAASPGIFQYGGGHAVATNPDGSVNGSANPVEGGAVIVAYLTGIGALDNPVPTGETALADPLSRPVGEVRITINGQETGVIFLGLTPGFIGLAQANIDIPDLPPGDYDLVIIIDGVASAPVRISIR